MGIFLEGGGVFFSKGNIIYDTELKVTTYCLHSLWVNRIAISNVGQFEGVEFFSMGLTTHNTKAYTQNSHVISITGIWLAIF